MDKVKESDRDKVNLRQKEFYNTKKKNLATKTWSYFRNGLLNRTRKNIGMEREILDLHLKWFGDLSKKKVLDLGCFEGNSLSIHLAKNSKQYLAIDLSEKGIAQLSNRLRDISNAEAVAIDFLSNDFKEKEFDLIYAYGVLHHFEDINYLISKLQEKLNEEGQIISYDPLKTSMPIKFLRQIYRPFQTDKDWEWPFSKSTYYKFADAFEIKERRAVLGKSKWFFLLNILPLSSNIKNKIAHKWHQEDWTNSQFSDSAMFQGMHLTMLMQKKSNY